MKSIILPAETGLLEKATGFVDSLLVENACPYPTRMQIRLAVEEIFVNIASYAYPSGEGTAELELSLLADPKRVRITFIDQGLAFDPLAKEKADTSEAALMERDGGLGILLVQEVMDSVTYKRVQGQNILTVEKAWEEDRHA